MRHILYPFRTLAIVAVSIAELIASIFIDYWTVHAWVQRNIEWPMDAFMDGSRP